MAIAEASSGPASLDRSPEGAGERVDASTRGRLADSLLAQKDEILRAWYDSQFLPELVSRYKIAGVKDRDRGSLLQSFLWPLFRLLAEYVRTGEDRYRDVYLNERLRYAPHRAAPEIRVQFFEEVLPADEAALLDAISRAGGPASTLAAIVADIHAPLRHAPSRKPLRLLTIGDCLMTELRVTLPGLCRQAGIDLDMRLLYFSARMGRGLSIDQAVDFLKEFPADLIGLSFLSFEGIPFYPALLREADSLGTEEIAKRVDPIAGLIGEFVRSLREHTDAPFLIHNAGGLPLTSLRRRLPFLSPISKRRWCAISVLNDAIRDLVEHTPNSILIDEATVTAARGYRECAKPLVPRQFSRGADFHTSRFGGYLSEDYFDVIHSFRTLGQTKVLLVDFDNTLWDGVMADGPVRHRHDFQALLRRLKEAGILLVAVSKNDPANVRWDEMTLEPDDFVLRRIGWDLKVRSIAEVARTLDLGLDSFVFLDDNPAERALVQGQFPELRTLDPGEPTTIHWLERMLRFPNTRETEEARSRTEIYRQQSQRREALSQSFDYASMMTALGLEVRFGRAQKGELDRVAELIQRTNQFNTTTIRYGKHELQAMLASSERAVYVASLSDKFGSVGLVCVAIVEKRPGERVFDSFVMSCRAMGFELERLVLKLVIDAEGGDGVRFVGRYVATERNTPCKDLFASNGFARRSEGEWVLEPDVPRPERPSWFKVDAR